MADLHKRVALTGLGTLSAVAFYLLFEGLDQAIFSDRLALILGSFVAAFGLVALMLTAKLSLKFALIYAVALALGTAALVALCALRWPEAAGFFATPWPALAAFVVTLLPLPFVVAFHVAADPLDYEEVFVNAFSFVTRSAIGLLFTLAIWIVIWLCDVVLRGIGLRVIGDFAATGIVPYIVTGASFGFAISITQEFSVHRNSISLWLLRLLLPILMGFSALFVIAAIGSDFDESYFPVFVLLLLAAIGLTLCTLAVGSKVHGQASDFVLISAMAMGVLAVMMAFVAIYALRLQIIDSGWSPDRIAFVVWSILIILQGFGYTIALPLRRNWGQGVRRVNLVLAGLTYGCGVIWLTPLLNAEGLSARAEVARFAKGTASDSFSAAALHDLGYAGAAAQEVILQDALARGDSLLSSRIQGQTPAALTVNVEKVAEMIEDLRLILPVSPSSATGMRDSFLMLMDPWELEEIVNSCAMGNEEGQPGCVLVVGDLLPQEPGEEAVLALERGGWVSLEGLYLQGGEVRRREIRTHEGRAFNADQARALILEWQKAPPPISPLSINQLGTGKEGLFFLP